MPYCYTGEIANPYRAGKLICGWLVLTIVLLCAPALPVAAAEGKKPSQKLQSFALESVTAKAKGLAAKPYREPDKIPDSLLRMTYDQWRDIRFRTDKSLWRAEKLPFEIQFFHPGLYYDRAITIHIVDGAKTTRLAVTREMFNYGRNPFQQSLPKEVGAAGFRFHAPIKNKAYYDEFLVFLGASYLRAVAKNHHYGLSARGLALNVAAEEGEEFPWFREFWIIKPRPGDKSVMLYALLDSPSITGAYQYQVTPGDETVIEVDSHLFTRKPIKKLGVAPLTSMFLFGENTSPRKQEDYRPEVHDSDGLLIHFNSGEWLWRPIQNPRILLSGTFMAPDVRGFGLLQRDHNFASYEDLEARYENRPSVWIEPKGDWGPGVVELVQIPSDSEINDNIVSYWRPEQTVPAGSALRFAYTMHWLTPAPLNSPPGHVVSTRVAKGKDDLQKIFVLDWDGPELQKLTEETAVEGVVSVEGGARLLEQQIFKNTITGGWRLAIHIGMEGESAINKMMPDKRPPVEMRAFLKHGADILTETWSYTYKQ